MKTGREISLYFTYIIYDLMVTVCIEGPDKYTGAHYIIVFEEVCVHVRVEMCVRDRTRHKKKTQLNTAQLSHVEQ